MIATRLVQKYPELFDGLVLDSPFLGIPDFVPSWQVSIARFLGQYPYLRDLPISKLDSNLICRDPAVPASFQADPLCYHGFTNALFAAASLEAQHHAMAGANSMTLPILAMHGDEDKICPLSETQRLVEEAGSKDKKMRVFSEGFHILRLEPHNKIQNDFYDQLIEWITEHC